MGYPESPAKNKPVFNFIGPDPTVWSAARNPQAKEHQNQSGRKKPIDRDRYTVIYIST
jgi:hypothetical protein